MENMLLQYVDSTNYIASCGEGGKRGLSMGNLPSMHTRQEKVDAIVNLVEFTKWEEIIIIIDSWMLPIYLPYPNLRV